MNPKDKAYQKAYNAFRERLIKALASDADSKLKKVLLVSAASYFASSAESVGSLGFGESS
jgi:hypothetical protein